MSNAKLRKSLLKRAGVSGVGKAKRTPSHKTKSHVVVANCNGKPKLIRFGEQGAKTNQNVKTSQKDRAPQLIGQTK